MPDDVVLYYLEQALGTTRQRKPNDRSERDRKFAILITELEKYVAIYKQWQADFAVTQETPEE